MKIAKFQMSDGRIAKFQVPEDATPEQAQEMMAAQVPSLPSAAPASLPEESSFGDEAMRQLGLTARAMGPAGAGALAGAALGSVVPGVGTMVGAGVGGIAGWGADQLSQLVGNKGYRDMLPQPREGMEQTTQAVVGGATDAALMSSLALRFANSANPLVRELSKSFTATPGAQMQAGGIAGGTADQLEQAGFGEGAQMAGAIAAPMATSLTARAVSPLTTGVRNLFSPYTRPVTRTAERVGQMFDKLTGQPVSPLSPTAADDAAARVVADVAGNKGAAIATAIRNGEIPETAAQAAAPVGRAEFSGLERLIEKRAPSVYGTHGEVARGHADFATQAKNDMEAAAGPIRDLVMRTANNAPAGQGLSVMPIMAGLGRLANAPGNKGNKMLAQVTQQYRDELARVADSNTGGIRAEDLYSIRKTFGKTLKAQAKDLGWDKSAVNKVTRDVQDLMDLEMFRASGAVNAQGTSSWKEQLGIYSKGFRELENLKQRQKMSDKMGMEGQNAAAKIYNQDTVPISLPNLLSRPMMATNALIRYLEGQGGEAAGDALARLMQPQNKNELAGLLERELLRRNSRMGVLPETVARGTAGAVAGIGSE